MGEKETASEPATNASGDGPVDLVTPQPEVTIPDGAIDLTEDKNGGVYKVIKKDGYGNAHPSPGDSCTVHYVGTLPDGTKFDSSRDRGEPFNFNVGRSQVIKGWDLALASMKKGELCEIIVKPEFAYGEAGSAPRIPPNTTLIFEIELILFEGEDISPDHDKSITRSVQKDGEKFEYPNDGSKLVAHVIGLYEGREFRNGEVEYILGEASEVGLPEGVDKSFRRFRKGERSCIHLKPHWGYGEIGNEQYGIPANAELDFELWLKDFEKAKESWQMQADEKLEESERMKQRGAEFFQQGKNQLAAAKYKRIIELLEHECRYEGEKKEKRDSIYLAAHNNLAMVYLKIGNTMEAIRHCEKVLEEDGKNVKALYRRAQAYQNQNDFEDALGDYQKVLELEPDNKAAQANVVKCKNGMAEVKKKQKAVFANMFEKLAKTDGKGEPVQEEIAKDEDKPSVES